MRSPPNDLIWNLWSAGGPFVGDNGAPHLRVTVEIGWQLRKSTVSQIGSYKRGPIRWFQRFDNSQTETEVPNVWQVDIDRTIDVDAASCTIQLLNQAMWQNIHDPDSSLRGEVLGQPGYYWPGRGESAASQTLWDQTVNEWNGVLQPNALIRTYQGYGGRDKTIDQALADGNIVQTGIWLVDKVKQDARTSALTITCRDMAKLLIEQEIYPPLIPSRKTQTSNSTNPDLAYYPLNYFRWVYTNHPVIPYGNTIYHTGFTSLEEHLSADQGSSHYDSDHDGNAAIDGDDVDTYWLSAGKINLFDAPGTYSAEWVQFNISGNPSIGGINVIPYGGNYEVYVSIMSNGAWQDHPVGTGDRALTPGGDQIKYVVRQGIGWERPKTIDISRPDGTAWPNCSKIRLTFSHLAKLGPNPPLRAGLRDLQIGTFSNTVTGKGNVVTCIQRGSNDPTVSSGYWVVGSDGRVFSFGGLKFYGAAGQKSANSDVTGMASNPVTGKGYRLCSKDGHVYSFGDLYNHGSLISRGVTLDAGVFIEDIENGDNGVKGYYLLGNDGQVHTFGEATFYGHDTQLGGPPQDVYYVSALGVRTTTPKGYWTMTTAHEVQAHGGAPDVSGLRPASPVHGAWQASDGLATALEPASHGHGYWTVTALGYVRSYGNQEDGVTRLEGFGDLTTRGINITIGDQKGITDMVRTASNNGYWLVGQDGQVYAFGDAEFYGSLTEQYSKIGDGNYTDYTDIVKDLLLWSGWWFRDPTDPTTTPVVFGNLESTGIYSPDNLTEDFFDKKPVIDVVNTLKEIVGYINYADEIGAYHFKSPNVWSIGNFLETGAPTARMAIIEDKKQIIGYETDFDDTDARSQITIATDDPALNLGTTKSVTITSQWGPDVLRGIERPALWVNGKFLTTEIQTTMAHLIDLHLFMQQRQGSLTMPANPILQIDDQVQIYERSSSETYIHYLRGYTTHQDAYTGEFTQTLQTHWMGDGDAWFLSYNPAQNIVELPETDSPDSSPAFTAASPPDGGVGSFYSYSFIASGDPAPTFNVTSGSLPPGMVLQSTGLLSGTPTTSGSYSFQVTASNGVGSPAVTSTITLDVSLNTPVAPSLQTVSPPNGTVGTGYSYTFVATGSPAPTFSIVSGSLPTGLSLGSVSGALTGTPSAAATYNFTVRATNAGGTDSHACVVIISSGGGGGGSSPPPSGGYFSLSAAGASLPGGMTAAGADAAANAAVNRSTWEPRTDNNTANHTIVSQPTTLGTDLADLDSTWNSTYLPRITGNIGLANPTTDEIIQWAAYKWGWSDEYVRAELITETNWHQNALGDFEPASNGHRVFDRSDDPSPTSFGLPQIRWYYHPPGYASNSAQSSYPNSHISSAFALDFFLAILRGIYDGHSTYLNGGGMAAAGDAWGAIGSWFSGGWHDSGANSYIATTQGHLSAKPWLQSGF